MCIVMRAESSECDFFIIIFLFKKKLWRYNGHTYEKKKLIILWWFLCGFNKAIFVYYSEAVSIDWLAGHSFWIRFSSSSQRCFALLAINMDFSHIPLDQFAVYRQWTHAKLIKPNVQLFGNLDRDRTIPLFRLEIENRMLTMMSPVKIKMFQRDEEHHHSTVQTYA